MGNFSKNKIFYIVNNNMISDSNNPPQNITSYTNMAKVYQSKKSGVSIYDKEKKKWCTLKTPMAPRLKMHTYTT
jgi:hypothetical protein